MAIKVILPISETTATVSGLYQWDYGQTLEIECPELGSEIVEVHFACPGMSEALPRVCAFTNGVGTVPIPDQCLEQEHSIMAWVCRIDETQSHTIKTINLPLTKRTRPVRTHDVPTELVNKYEELIVEVQETVDSLKAGNITAGKALHADSANKANTAEKAEYATFATTAETAEEANYTSAAGALEMKLVASCAISAGEGIGTVALKANTPYLVVYKSNLGYTSSGVIILSSSTGLGLCPLRLIYGFRVDGVSNGFNAYILEYSSTNVSNPYPVTTENGTAYIYSFGHIVV